MSLCCENFKELALKAGEKGFSAIPLQYEDLIFFIFQFRGSDSDEKAGITKIGDIGIKYCPFCGAELATVIKENRAYVQYLIQKNKHLLEYHYNIKNKK